MPSGERSGTPRSGSETSAIFVNDAFPEMGPVPGPVRLWIYSEDVDAAFKRAVDAGAEVKCRRRTCSRAIGSALWSMAGGTAGTSPQHTEERASTPDEMKRAGEAAAAEWNKEKK